MIWQQIFWNSEKFDVYYFRYSPEKIHNNKFHEKIFFVKSKDLVIILTLSGFGVFYLLMGSVTSDFIWIPLLPFHEKKIFFYENHDNQIFLGKKSYKDSQEKTNQNNACFVCFLEEKKINGARKEIFLNREKKPVMHDVEL